MTAQVEKRYTIVALLSALCLAACGDRTADTPDSLAKDGERLKVVMRQCRDQPGTVDEKTCAAASEAWRRRFLNADKGGQSNVEPPSSQTPPRAAP